MGKTTDTMSTAELASSYAALILADDGVDITADKLNTLIKAAGVDDVEPIWTSLFAKALEGKDVKDLLLNVGSGGGAAAAPAAGGAAAAGGRLLLRRRRRRRRSRTRTWVSVSSTKRAAPITPTPTTSSPKFDLMHFTMVGVTHSGCMLSCRFGHEVLKHGMREEGK